MATGKRAALPRYAHAALLAALASWSVAGCGALEDALSPGRSADALPARVSLAARVPRLSAGRNATVQLQVQASYARTDGTRVPLGTQAITLDDAPTQQVPLTIDLAPCLADARRVGGANGPCMVSLDLALVAGERLLDRQTVGPLRLAAGGVTTVPEPVQLAEVATVVVGAPGGVSTGEGAVRIELGGSVTLAAAITSTAGGVLDGRAVHWTSDAPDVATVDASTGVVVGAAVGRARITATTVGGSGRVDVAVVPRPSPISVSAGGTSGSGLVRSSPGGIDCTVSAGQAQGVCEFTFPGDARVTLTVTPGVGATFGGWGGACALAGGAATCELDAGQARAATVSFAELRRLSVGGTGVGTVTGAPGGIACPVGGAAAGTCEASYAEGTTVALTAAAGPGHAFAGWTGACAGTSGPQCTVTMRADATVGARFSAPLPLSVAGDGEGSGTVHVGGGDAPLVCTIARGDATPCTGTFAFGAVVTLAATPTANSTFAGWAGACSGTGACQVTMDQARSVRATFARRLVTLSLSMSGAGSGWFVVGSRAGCALATGANAASCQLAVPAGDPVTIVAAPGIGAMFAGWGGACAGRSADSCMLTPTADATVSAHFAVEIVPLTVRSAIGATGGGRVSGMEIACTLVGATGRSGICDGGAPYGSTVTLVASPDPSSTFGGWGGACSAATTARCVLPVTSATSVTVRFDIVQHPLTVALAGTGGGRIASTAVGVDCPGACAAVLPIGTTVTLTATPDTASTFAGWTGACAGAGTSPTCTVTMAAAQSVTATFAQREPPPLRYELDVTFAGSGSGRVSSPTGIVCQTACRLSFSPGAVVTLLAQATSGRFVGWSGACSGTASCIVTMSQARSVVATFRH